MEKNKKQNKKVRFVVVREFSGDKTMREAFEQLIERNNISKGSCIIILSINLNYYWFWLIQ